MQPNYEKHILLKIKLHGVSVLSSKTKRQAKQNRDFGCEELRTELKAKSRIPFVLSILKYAQGTFISGTWKDLGIYHPVATGIQVNW